MAGKRSGKVRPKILELDELRQMRRTKVRYGRANLTIARWGQVAFSPLAVVIESWRQCQASTEDVAWAYVRERVIDQTPSFDWETADLERLVRMVTEVSDNPEIKARTLEALAEELNALEKKERADWEKASKAFTKNIQALTFDASKAFKVPSLADQFKTTTFVTADWDKIMDRSIRGLSFDVAKTGNLVDVPRFSNLVELPKTGNLVETMKLSEILLRDLKPFAITEVFQEAFGDRAPVFAGLINKEDVRGLADALIETSRAEDQAEVAEAVEGVADVADGPEPPDLATAIEELSGQVQELAKALPKAKDSVVRQLILGVAIVLVSALIIFTLAKYGVVNLDPSQFNGPKVDGQLESKP